MVPLRKSLALLVLVLLAFTFHTPTTSAALAKAEPDLSLKASVAGDKLAFSKWAGFSTVDVAMPAISGFTEYRYETIQLTDGYEINLILNKPPPTNIFYYPLTVKNAEFYYQPPLTPEEIARGCIRPDNVVGSYAVYGPKKDNEYGTGKIMHIYRPKVTDAKGAWIWGVLNYKEGVLSVTVDPVWLSKAVYPVTVDPIFGYNSVGGSTTGLVQDWAYGDLYTTAALPATSNGVSVYAYIASTAGTTNFKVCAWAGTNGGALIADSPLVVSATAASYAWKTANYVSAPTFSASTTYNIGFLVDTNNGRIAYDDIGTEKEDSTNSYASPGNFDWINFGVARFSAYIVIGSAPTITSSAITDMDDSDNCYAMKKYYNFQTEITDTDGATDIQKISVRGMQGANVRWLVNATSLDGVPAYAIVTGASTIDLDSGSCSFGEAGNVGTLTLKIRFEWDATNEEDCEIGVWARDVGGATVGWTTVQSDYFDVISRLVTYNFASNVTSTTINQPLKLSGYVYYATTATGDEPSSSYPPDAQFTAVKVYDDDSVLKGTNNTVTNGFFSVIFDSSGVLKTTAYRAYLDMTPDYTDGYAPDGDIVYVTTGSSYYQTPLIDQAFAYYGLAVANILAVLTAFVVYFASSATAMISLIASIMTAVIFVAGSLIYWLNLFVNFFVGLFTAIGNILNGTSTIVTGLGDMWAYFGFATWASAVPVFAFILWVSSVSSRTAKSGRSNIEIMVGDLQIVTYLVDLVWNWAYTVFNFVVNIIMQFLSVIVP